MFLRIGSFLKRFKRDTHGNVIVMFAASVTSISIGIGAAIDIGSVVSVNAKLQNAADSAVLRAMQVSQTAPGSDKNIPQKEAAIKAFDSNFKDSRATSLSKDLEKKVENNKTTQTFTVTGQVPAVFGTMLGKDSYPIKAVAKSEVVMAKSEIALVLDVTKSMDNDNRMVHLKSSVDSVLNSLLENGVNTSGSKVAIVPFNTQVRIAKGTTFPYIDYGTQTLSEACNNSGDFDGNTCTAVWDTLDKVCVPASNMTSCRDTAKGFYKREIIGAKTYYYVTYRAYETSGSNYKIYTLNQTFYFESYTDTWKESCNSETGVCTPAGSGTKTRLVFDKRTNTTDTKSNLNNFNDTPANYKSVTSTHLKFNVNNSNGYGANLAYQTTNNSYYGSKRVYVYPARADSKVNWSGCVIDRTQPYDTNADRANSATPASLYPARNCASNDLREVQALSDNIAAAKTFVQTLKPAGNTNITIGVQWGMEVLSPDTPMEGGVAFKTKGLQKYMIVITDGNNTQNRFTSKQVDIDARTKLACEEARKLEITIYTVRVMEGNSELLRGCASKPEYFYDLKTADQLKKAMEDIFTNIKKLRLTQ